MAGCPGRRGEWPGERRGTTTSRPTPRRRPGRPRSTSTWPGAPTGCARPAGCSVPAGSIRARPVLLRKAELPRPGTDGPLLDLGCGYGPDRVRPGRPGTPGPDLRRGRQPAGAGARAGQCRERRCRGSGGRRGPGRRTGGIGFHQIWSNPPIRIGKADLHALLRRWLPRLAPDGTAWLVAAATWVGTPWRRGCGPRAGRSSATPASRVFACCGSRGNPVGPSDSGRGESLNRGLHRSGGAEARPGRRPGTLHRRLVPGGRGGQGRAGRSQRGRQDHAAAHGRR
jgi:hypothetical protein